MEEKLGNLNDTSKEKEEEETRKNIGWPLVAKILIFCLIFIVVSLVVLIILLIASKTEKEEDKDDEYEKTLEKAGYFEPWNDLYGIKMSNLTYDNNSFIENSFKKGGVNYRDEIGDINNGKDYSKNERNIYDLYIPYSVLNNKEKINGIFLFIHGGSWTSGTKEDIEFLCSRYAKMGYITSTMGYTVMSGEYPEYNIYRILDEISACIQNIKKQLNILGFNNLEMALGGISAGAHIALLYGYSIKNTIIPIKFLINIVGPLSLEPEFWYKPAVFNQTLEEIEPSNIDKAIETGEIIPIFKDSSMISLMNGFLGNRYTEEETKEMIENGKIKKDSEKYQEMFNAVKYSFPYIFIDNNTLPTLCEYAGNDSLVGISMYKYLKQLSQKYGNKLDLVYMRYADHGLISYDTENGIQAMRDIHNQILIYAQSYFSRNNN